MIPVGDSVRSRTTPYVNVTIIVVSILVFLYELTLSDLPNMFFPALPQLGFFSERFIFFADWGSTPACLTDRFGFSPETDPHALQALCPDSERTLLTPFTAMFIHGSFLHLIGNMIFLWVFGDNVEDAMGHLRYALFYAVVGLAATSAHVAVNQSDLVPAIGASGAIAGVLGAYLVRYPRATVSAILPIFLFVWIPLRMPAVVLIGIWFLLQLFSGVSALTAREVVGAGGVAWFAHIGGFVAGLILVKFFLVGRSPPRAPRLAISRRW
ncbi:MAG: rhomboid family intramembrane serine protease [Chloroflexi bacterium]|nr:rhomboid family intramembrane serine protease [Chloroflexota bacterium]